MLDCSLFVLRKFQFTCPSRSTTSAARCFYSSLAEHDGMFVLFSLTMQVSIHVPLAEHDKDAAAAKDAADVSIHVPLAEHDGQSVLCDHATGVSIHVPLAEHDCNHRQF